MRIGLISVFCVAAWCQAEWKSVPPPPVDTAAKEPVWSVVAHDGALWASTPEGLSTSRDSGRTWRAARPPEFPRSAHSAGIAPGGRLFSAGGCLFATAPTGLYGTCDDGASWKREPGMGYIDRLGGDAGQLIAGYSDDDSLFTSDDKGQTWRVLQSFIPGDIGFDGIFQDGPRLWMSAGGAYYSDDKGKSWHLSSAPTGGLGSFAEEAGMLWIFGQNTVLAASADGGETWSRRNVPVTGILAPLVPSGVASVDGVLFTSGTEGANIPAGVFMSTDTGKTWVPRDQGLPLFPNAPNDSAMAGASAVYALGKVLLARTHQGIYRSEDLGASWQAANAGISAAALRNAEAEGFFIGEGLAFRRTVVNGQFLWYMSADSARSWRAWDSGVPDIESLAFTATTALAFRRHGSSTPPDPVYQSKDGMKSWSPLRGPWTSGPAFAPDSLYASGTHIYLTGNAPLGVAMNYWHSPDEGVTWESDSGQAYAEKLSWHAEVGNVRFRSEGESTMVSADSGRTWKLSLKSGPVEESAIVGQTLMVRIFDSVYVTSNAGKTWRSSPVENMNPQLFGITAFAGRFFAATPKGLRVSLNGLAWEDAGETGLSFRYARAIVLFGDIMMAATNKGLFVSKDLGAHWQPSILPQEDDGQGSGPQADGPVLEPRVAWLGAWKETFFAGLPNTGIYLSMDTGKTWIPKYVNASLWGMWAGPDNLIFDQGDIMEAHDMIPGGHEWSPTPPTRFSDNSELAMADGGLYLSKTEGAFMSEAPEAPWSSVKLPGQGPHDFLAGDGKNLVASSGDDLYMRSAANAEWQPIASGLPKDGMSALSMDGGRLFAGLLSQGLWMNAALPVALAPKAAGPLLLARPSIYLGADGSPVFRMRLSGPARLRLSLHAASGRTLAYLDVEARPGIQELRPNLRGRGVTYYRLEADPEPGRGPKQTFRGSLAPFR